MATFPYLTSGHCALIQTPEGRNILVDTGSKTDSAKLIAALRKRNILSIDLLILTSPDSTSIGGVPAILNSNIQVRSIWSGELPPDNSDAKAAILAIEEHQTPNKIVHASDSDEIGPSLTQVSVVWPPQIGPASSRDPLICRVDFRNFTLILCGGSTAEGENSLVGDNAQRLNTASQHCVLEVTGGGIESGTSPDFLRLTEPELAIIDGGNEHVVSPLVLHRLEAAGAEVWRTDEQGDITVTTDGRRPPVTSGSGL